MLGDLREEIELEVDNLAELARLARPIVEMPVAGRVPSAIEVVAMGGILHSFYSGLESVFRRILKAFDEPLPQDPNWHRQLLEAVARPTAKRPAVISTTTALLLSDYLRFRHRFRNLYSSQLDWAEMTELVLNYPVVHSKVVQELEDFLPRVEGKSISGI